MQKSSSQWRKQLLKNPLNLHGNASWKKSHWRVSTGRRLESRTVVDLHLRPDRSLMAVISEAVSKTRPSRLFRPRHPAITKILQYHPPYQSTRPFETE